MHRHEVSLDLERYFFSAAYTFKKNWDYTLRIPYDIKKQKAFITEIEPLTDEDKEAILANQEIHHRNNTYRGFSDFSFLVSKQKFNYLKKGDFLKWAIGTTIPVGKTEEDPFKLGNAGLKHLHIQFGTGTWNPLLELNYHRPLNKRLSLNSIISGKFPFYENNKKHKAPPEITSGLKLEYSLKNNLFLSLGYTYFYQGRGYWDSLKDENSGLKSKNWNTSLIHNLKNGDSISLSYRHPISQKTLSDNGDAFKQGKTISFSYSKTFKN